jgi:hypothetical protein
MKKKSRKLRLFRRRNPFLPMVDRVFCKTRNFRKRNVRTIFRLKRTGERAKHLMAAVVHEEQFSDGIPIITRGQRRGKATILFLEVPRQHNIVFMPDFDAAQLDCAAFVVDDVFGAARFFLRTKAAAEVKAERLAIEQGADAAPIPLMRKGPDAASQSSRENVRSGLNA